MFSDIVTIVTDVKTQTVRGTNGDITVLNSRVAIYHGGKDNDTYIDVNAWGKTADMIAEHFHKGNQIYIEGDIRDREKKITTPDKTMLPYQSYYIQINSFKLVFGRKEAPEGAKENS